MLCINPHIHVKRYALVVKSCSGDLVAMSAVETRSAAGVPSRLFGITAYAASQGAVLLWGLFLANVGPFRIDGRGISGENASLAWAADLGLVLLFGLQHSAMARPGFKARITKLVPPHLERSTFVGVSALVLLAMAALWQPLPGVVYAVDGAAAVGLWILHGLGWALVVVSVNLIDNLALHGLRQSFSGDPSEGTGELVTPSLYKLVRHPMMTGFLLVLWATPHMSEGRLLVAISMTFYILVGVHFEERALMRAFGRAYSDYRERVPALLPWPR